MQHTGDGGADVESGRRGPGAVVGRVGASGEDVVGLPPIMVGSSETLQVTHQDMGLVTAPASRRPPMASASSRNEA